MDSFHQPAQGLRSQFTVKAMAKKIAKSIVGKSIGSDQRIAPNVLLVARCERARTPSVRPQWPRRGRLSVVRAAGTADSRPGAWAGRRAATRGRGPGRRGI